MGKKKAPTRKSSRGLRGNSHSKQVKSLVLFAVEGATEKEYLKALNQHRYRGAFALDFCGSGSSSESSLKNLLVNVKRKASDLGSDNVSGAWIVCDVDENQPHAENLEKWLTEQSRLSRGVVRLSLREHVLEPDRRFRPQRAAKQMEAGNLREGDGHSRVAHRSHRRGLPTGAASAGELRAGRDRVGRGSMERHA